MSDRQPDRELRRAVARMRSLPATDFDAVLGTMDAGQRTRILDLLGELEGQHSGSPGAAVATGVEVVLPSDLSPWLVARINGCGDGGDETADQFTMTDHAHKALRRCAAALVPQPAPMPRSISLIGRIAGMFGATPA